MEKIFLTLIVITLVLFSDSVLAQVDQTTKPDFKIDVDVAQFYGDSSQVFVELYYAFRENIFTYQNESGKLTGKAIFTWKVQRDSTIISVKDWAVAHSVEDSIQTTRTKTLFGLQSIGLAPGSYKTTLICTDAYDSTRYTRLSIPLNIEAYPIDKECFSDIELCTSIQSAQDNQSIFYKNTLDVVPNPSRLYGTGLPILYFYTTVYNLLVNNSQPNVIFRTSILDAVGNELMKKDKVKRRLYNASVEVGTFNLTTLRTGTYLFRTSLIDSSNNVLTSKQKRFYVYKYGSTPDSSLNYSGMDYTSSKYAVMNEQDLDRAFDYAHYIASSIEREQYINLTDKKAKQKFLFDFWLRRDVDNQQMVNEKETEYYKRVDYTNQQFGSGFREGWKSDRGRVYIVYGPYDEIERVPSTSESNPYEIWRYHNIQGGVEFIFVDKDGMGNIILVHSTHRDELQDKDWYTHYAQKMR